MTISEILVKERNEQGQERRWSYDANGCLTKYVDRDGSQYRFEYDSWNILSTVIEPSGHRRTIKVNGERFISEVVDESGHAHNFAYDQVDRLREVRRFGKVKESYEHDFGGHLTRKLAGDGRVLLEKTWSGNRVEEINIAESGKFSFAYEDDGLTAIAADDHQLSIQHNPFGDRVSDLRDGLGVEHEFSGEFISSSSVLGRFVTTFDYGPDGVTVIDPTGNRHMFTTEGEQVTKRLANGTTEVTTFDHRGLILEKNTVREPVTWNSTYRYSGEGYLNQIVDSRHGTTEIQCDENHRISSVNNGTYAQYRYDQSNNLLEKPGLTDVQVGPGNQVLQANGESFQYNDRNAICQRSSRSGNDTEYHYDGRDQLKSVKTGSNELTAIYDVTGRRIRKSSAQGDTLYYWDSNRLAAEVWPDKSLRVYIYASHLALNPFMFVDYQGVEADPASGTCYYLRHNHLGAPVEVEDAEHDVVWSASYDAYGLTKVSIAKIEFNLRLPGHYFDVETGLHYNRYRYYDPEIGRYIQADPIGLGGGNNLYAYCHNPLVEVDVRGLDPKCGGSKSTNNKDKEKTDRILDNMKGLKSKVIVEKRRKGETALDAAKRKANEFSKDHSDTNQLSDNQKKKIPGVITVVRDKKTGKTYTAFSGEPALDSANAHPQLGMPTKSKVKGRSSGNCGEPKALNAALNDGARKKDLEIATVDLRNESRRGQPKKCCANCQITTKKTKVLTD